MKITCLFYSDFFFFCSESEEDLKVMVGHFVEVCRRGLKVNADMNKVMVLGGEERFVYEVLVEGP